MIYAILFGLVAIIIVAFVIFVSRQPDEFTVTRSEAISASPAALFEQVNDLHKWIAWSPWEGIDPMLKRSYDGPESGIGANYAWDGNKTGAGSMTITDSQPTSLIRMNLDFVRPFKASNVVEFTFNPRGDHTIVAWTMSGKDTFFFKLFSLVCNRDKMCGDMFSQGLASLKKVCENSVPT